MPKQSAFEFADDPMTEIRSKATRFVFQLGVDMLIAQGLKEPAARAFLGKRLKEIGKPSLLYAICDAAFREVTDARTYLAAAKRNIANKPIQQANDDDRRSDGVQPWMK